jgi:hypothetical protein
LWKSCIMMLVVLLSAGCGATLAADRTQCVKTQCEDKGRKCVEALYVIHEACMKAGNKKCRSVQPADQFNCLKAELSPCGQGRNERQNACLEDVRSCYASCGPINGGRVGYWCVTEFGNIATAAFCALDAADPAFAEQCGQAFGSQVEQLGSMTCDPL